MHRPMRGRGPVGLLLRAGAVLALTAAGAGLVEAVIADDVLYATRNGGDALAASVLRGVHKGSPAAAGCVTLAAPLLLTWRGAALCRSRVRGCRPGVPRV
ncbi:hypothetical protein GCM10010231_18980 [Streptomyces sindenensis]|nr:hypothetical protein GCM10010231_18980 [Streptomyces sindenensis]